MYSDECLLVQPSDVRDLAAAIGAWADGDETSAAGMKRVIPALAEIRTTAIWSSPLPDPHWLPEEAKPGRFAAAPFPTAKTRAAAVALARCRFSHFPASLVQSTPFSPSILSSVFLFLHSLLLRPSFLSVLLAIAPTGPGDNPPLTRPLPEFSPWGHASSLDRPPPPPRPLSRLARAVRMAALQNLPQSWRRALLLLPVLIVTLILATGLHNGAIPKPTL